MSLLPLLLAILGLLVGPLLYAVPHWKTWDRVLDAFTIAAVGGLCVFHLLPEAIEHGGWVAITMASLGMVLPRFMQQLQGPWLLLLGLVIHAAVESAAVGTGQGGALGMAVVLHRVPVGLAVFSLFHEHPRTSGMGWVAIGVLVAATAAGFFAGPPLLVAAGGLHAGLEAAVAGMLMHVIWEHGDHGEHDHGEHSHSEPQPANGPLVAIAAISGLTVVIGMAGHGHEHGGTHVVDTAWMLLRRSAPALLLAYAGAALVHSLSGRTALRGTRYGIGIVALMLSIPLLGPVLAVVRGAVALALSWATDQLHTHLAPSDPSWPGLRFGFVDLVDETLPWVLLGVVLAAFSEGVLHDLLGLGLPSGALVVGFALLGLPLYIRASASTPMAAVLLHVGFTPGAAVAFLLTASLPSPRSWTPVLLMAGAVAVGWLLDQTTVPRVVLEGAATHLESIALLGLAGLFVASLVRQGPRGMIRRVTPDQG